MNATICQRCGATTGDTASAGGLCMACLLQAALDDRGTADDGLFEERAVLPRQFGPYELLEEVGRGGMGVVYRARQTALDRTVAIKLLLGGVYSSEAALRRFKGEASAAASLQHPGIVTIHDSGDCDGQPYLVMDLIEGRNLAELCNGRPLATRRAAEILLQLATAVQHAHDRGILHRDLKPSNVLIDGNGRVCISDFGLARRLCESCELTLPGQMLGSPSYASPEQAMGATSMIGVATDVYGLGALFYHLLTGRAPFNAASASETLWLVGKTDPIAPRLLNPSLPRDLETICLKCLAKDPAHRYTTAAEVAADVERFIHEEPIRARPPHALYRIGKFARRHRTAVSAVAAVLAALVLGLLVALAGLHRAVVQRRAADEARAQAEQLVGLMMHELKPTLEQRGGLPQLVQLTEAAVRYFETLSPELRTVKTDIGHADALAALARLRGNALSDRVGAERALHAALVLRQKIARARPNDADAAAALLADEWNRPIILGRWSLEEAREFQQAWEKLLVRFPESAHVKRKLAEVAAWHGHLAATADQPGEALAAAMRSRSLVEELAAADLRDGNYGEVVELSFRSLSAAYFCARDFDKAVLASEQGLVFCTEELRADPGNLQIRRLAAESARNLSYRVSALSNKRARDAELIAREHFRVLSEANPGDQEARELYVFTHMMECIFLALYDGHLADGRAALTQYARLLAGLPEETSVFVLGEERVKACDLLAQLEARAGNVTAAREKLREMQRLHDAQMAALPVESSERQVVALRYEFSLMWTVWYLRDWAELERLAQATRTEIDHALEAYPANKEFLLRKIMVQAFHGLALQGGGQVAAAVPLLRQTEQQLRETPDVSGVFDNTDLRCHTSVALIRARAETGETVEARKLGDAILLTFGEAEPEEWWAKEWRARVRILVAGLLGPAEVTRKTALLDTAEKILTGPEAEGRITVLGKEDRATIQRLRRGTGFTPTTRQAGVGVEVYPVIPAAQD